MKFVAAVTAATLVMVPAISFAQGAGGAGSGAAGAGSGVGGAGSGAGGMSGTGKAGTGKGAAQPSQKSGNPSQGQGSGNPSESGTDNNSVPGTLLCPLTRVAVPLSAISLTKKKNKAWLTINTTKEAVKNASGYSYDKNDGVWNPM